MTKLSECPGFSVGGGGGGGGSNPAIGNVVGTTDISMMATASTPGRTIYSYTQGMIPGAAATAGNMKSRNVFGHWGQWMDNSANADTGFCVDSFSVNRATGAITKITENTDLWFNNSGGAMSTTYCAYEPMFGNFFSGGHNAYPGTSSHTFGHTFGHLDSSGTWNLGGTAATNADHGWNGCGCTALPMGGTAGMFAVGGYASSALTGSGNRSQYRVIESAASGPTVNSLVITSDWTSSWANFRAYWQPDVNTTPAGHVVSVQGTSLNGNGNYGRVEFRDTSTIDNVSESGNAYQMGFLMCGHGGTTLMVTGTDLFGTPGVNSPSFTSLKDGVRDPGRYMQDGNFYYTEIVGIGNNKYLCFRSNIVEGCDLIGIDSSQNFHHLQRFSLGSTNPSILDGPIGTSADWFVVFENDTDDYPKWLIQNNQTPGFSNSITVREITVDFDAYPIP